MSVPDRADPATGTVDRLRSRFLDAGMRVLARDGYGGFKQAAVCAETGLTTGGFYHAFRSWKDFEAALIAHWEVESTARVVDQLRGIHGAEARARALLRAAVDLPHATERALRVWSAKAPAVAAAVAEIDATRRAAIAEFTADLFDDADHAADWAAQSMMMLIGYQCSTDISPDTFARVLTRLLDDILAAPRRSPDSGGAVAQMSQ
ncbi:TetR/AcrR family transcriptional regulator [Gordonia shandongensis]|uniref:TetR/AcrR family transcriptional regulator n=1 Tax=Gordonia shandongensis TaxID=376351 RepID=UPI00041A86EF|nr:TetR/AcrR family transcriptional regulator [Gordonia shandongensis]